MQSVFLGSGHHTEAFEGASNSALFVFSAIQSRAEILSKNVHLNYFTNHLLSCKVIARMSNQPTSLREEIRQTKPFESPAQEAILGLYRTSDMLQRRFSHLVEPHGISLQQYNVLRILRGAGKEGTPTLDIAQRMIEKTPGITRLLDKLETKHLVRRKRCPEDRRQVLCWITDAGLILLAKLDKPLVQSGLSAMECLSQTEIRQLISILGKLRAQLT